MSLELIVGSMFSGKTTELLRRIRRLKSIGMRCVVINHSNDTRVEGAFVQTHDGFKLPAIKTPDLLLTDIRAYDAVAIDEAQFFPNVDAAVRVMVETHGKFVLVAGLNGDYRRQPFGHLAELLPVADDVTWTRAFCQRCSDGTLASFTLRLTPEETTVSVGGADKYSAVCRRCYEIQQNNVK